MAPNAGEAVGLEFYADGGLVLCIAGHAESQRADEVLYVVTDFMGDNVGLSEVPWRVELLRERIVESWVDIHAVIRRAVEGADSGGGASAATGGYRACKNYERGHFITGRILLVLRKIARSKVLRPHVFCRRENHTREVAGIGILRGYIANLALALRNDFATQERLFDGVGREKVYAPENKPADDQSFDSKAANHGAKELYAHAASTAGATATAVCAAVFEVIRASFSAKVHRSPHKAAESTLR